MIIFGRDLLFILFYLFINVTQEKCGGGGELIPFFNVKTDI